MRFVFFLIVPAYLTAALQVHAAWSGSDNEVTFAVVKTFDGREYRGLVHTALVDIASGLPQKMGVIVRGKGSREKQILFDPALKRQRIEVDGSPRKIAALLPARNAERALKVELKRTPPCAAPRDARVPLSQIRSIELHYVLSSKALEAEVVEILEQGRDRVSSLTCVPYDVPDPFEMSQSGWFEYLYHPGTDVPDQVANVLDYFNALRALGTRIGTGAAQTNAAQWWQALEEAPLGSLHTAVPRRFEPLAKRVKVLMAELFAAVEEAKTTAGEQDMPAPLLPAHARSTFQKIAEDFKPFEARWRIWVRNYFDGPGEVVNGYRSAVPLARLVERAKAQRDPNPRLALLEYALLSERYPRWEEARTFLAFGVGRGKADDLDARVDAVFLDQEEICRLMAVEAARARIGAKINGILAAKPAPIMREKLAAFKSMFLTPPYCPSANE